MNRINVRAPKDNDKKYINRNEHIPVVKKAEVDSEEEEEVAEIKIKDDNSMVINGKLTISVINKDLARQKVDCIVNSANRVLDHNNGVAK